MQTHFKIKRAPKFVSRIGEDATIRTFTKTGEDAHGDPVWDSTDKTVKAVRSFGTSTRIPEAIHSISGEHRTMAFEFTIDSDVVDFSVDPGHGKPPEIHYDNVRYKIMEMEPYPIGLTRLICESTKR